MNGTFASVTNGTDLSGWDLPRNLTNLTSISCCDYYQRTHGYVFTECDHGIDVIELEGKDSGALHNQYKAMDKEYPHLSWNWTELLLEVQKYCADHGIITNETFIPP